MPGTTSQTASSCIDTCSRGKDLAVLLGGGGVAGLVVLGAGDLASYMFSHAPAVLLPLFVVSVLLTAFLIGMSYSSYDQQISVLQRQLDDGSLAPDDVIVDPGRQRRAVRLRRWSLVFLLATALILVVASGYVWLAPR